MSDFSELAKVEADQVWALNAYTGLWSWVDVDWVRHSPMTWVRWRLKP